MKIAILGWGSLLWDISPDFDDQHDDWLYDGPNLKLEFSRISKTRNGALTLVIDEQNGKLCKVAYAISKRKSPDDAICDLRCREGTILKRIGYHFADGSRQFGGSIPDGLDDWAISHKLDVVIWTALQSNFKEVHGKNFSIDEATSYLQSLDTDGKAKAVEYIRRAPELIETPLRDELKTEPWFAAL